MVAAKPAREAGVHHHPHARHPQAGVRGGGMGMILGMGNYYQFSWAAQEPGLAGLSFSVSGCLLPCLRLDDSTEPMTMPSGTARPSASLIFDLRGPGIPGGNTPKSAELGSGLPMRISVKSYENCLPQARQTT